jgi:hypothetical protein
MDENNVFRDALKNFMFDVAGGGAIEHLADCGYTPAQIHGMLDYPVPYAQVREAYWKYCLKKKIIAEDKSALSKRRENVDYVTEYDAYGRKSLRRVVEYAEEKAPKLDLEHLSTFAYDPAHHGSFETFLNRYCCGDSADARERDARRNAPGACYAYVSCDFGLRMNREPEVYEAFLAPLTEEQRLYMQDIPWKRKTVWHQLNGRMLEILVTLYEKSSYHGALLLLHKNEEITF